MIYPEVKKQVYTIEVITREDGYKTIERTNDGFSLFELIGILSQVQFDLMRCFELPKFDETNRKVK